MYRQLHLPRLNPKLKLELNPNFLWISNFRAWTRPKPKSPYPSFTWKLDVCLCQVPIHFSWTDKLGKSVVARNYIAAVSFNNITRLAFGKRFAEAEGITNEQGAEFKGIMANGVKIGASLSIVEYIPWLRWMFPLEVAAIDEHGARRDRLTKVIMDEHTLARKKSGAKQHFLDALLTLQEEHDLSEDTVIGLLWVRKIMFITQACLGN